MNPEELIEKLINNQLSREEFELLLEGIDNEDVLARYEIYLQEQFEREIKESFLAEDQLVSEKPLLTISKSRDEKKSNKKIKIHGKFRYAAVVVFFIGVIFSVMFIVSQMSDNKDSLRTTAQLITKTTPQGRMFRMNLEDGSFVHLNAVSSIAYQISISLSSS